MKEIPNEHACNSRRLTKKERTSICSSWKDNNAAYILTRIRSKLFFLKSYGFRFHMDASKKENTQICSDKSSQTNEDLNKCICNMSTNIMKSIHRYHITGIDYRGIEMDWLNWFAYSFVWLEVFQCHSTPTNHGIHLWKSSVSLDVHRRIS